LNCKIAGVFTLVKLSDSGRRENGLSRLFFVAITIVPWIVMLWLLWPRR
jgi:hypothetical protein